MGRSRWPVAAWVAGGLGVVGAGLAWAGFGPVGVGVAVAGLAAGLVPGRGVTAPGSLAELLDLAQADPDGPSAPLADELQERFRRLDTHGDAIRDVVRKLQEHATLLGWVIDTLAESVRGSRDGLRTMGDAGERVWQRAERVREASSQGLAFMDTLSQSTEELFSGAETLNRSVEEATASIAQIYGALREIHGNVDRVSEASDRTTAFVAQVGRAMGEIRRRIDRSLALFQEVESSAGGGKDAVRRVGEGIDRIRGASENLGRAVQALGEQSREIEGILAVITEVAEETGLLSLNAAILAAQAGEKGAAFAVVADQIRSLARRTRENAAQIGELIRGVQANIAEANRGLAESLEAVEEGRGLGAKAEDEIEQIERAVTAAVEEAREIAGAAQTQDEQARAMVSAADEVNASLHRVAENLDQGMQEMDRVQALNQTLAALSQSLRAAADSHRDTGRETAELMASFAREVEEIGSLLEDQRRAAVALEGHLNAVAESGESASESLLGFHDIVRTLVAEADGLRADTARDGGAEPTEEEPDG